MTISIGSVLRLFKLSDLLTALMTLFSFTDILGGVVQYLKGLYDQNGRSGVIRAATIKEASLRKWASDICKQAGTDPNSIEGIAYADKVVKANQTFASALADFVAVFIPDSLTKTIPLS